MKRKNTIRYTDNDRELFQPIPTYRLMTPSRLKRWLLILSILLLALFMLLFTYSVHASEQIPLAQLQFDEVRQGQLLFRSEQGNLLAPTLSTHASLNVNGMIVRAKVKQQFSNPTSQWQEGVYVFPLPEDAAVDHLRMRIGERVIEGQVKERQQAKQIYQQAKAQGKKASLLEQQRPNMFTTSVANIAPGESIQVEIEYQQMLHYENERFSLRFPTAITPRYIPGKPVMTEESLSLQGGGWAMDTDQVPDASHITPAVVANQKQHNPVSINIHLDTGFALDELLSPYHSIKTRALSSHQFQIELDNPNVVADRDFVLQWKPQQGSAPRAAVFSQQLDENYYHMVMVMPPYQSQAQTGLAREVIYIIDTSGSMGGVSIRQAKNALQLALSQLSSRDYFNVIQFNSYTDQVFDTAVPATTSNLAVARHYVASLEAQGGTEMAPALQAALHTDSESSRVRQVVFLTDGSVGNERELFSQIQQQLGRSRLFTVGIGSAPNSFFMRKAAQFGRGTFTYIGDVNEVQSKMSELFSKLASPAMTDIELDWVGNSEWTQLPEKIPDLYHGQPVMVVASTSDPLQSLRIRGQQAQQSWKMNLSAEHAATASGIDVLWARQKIASLMDSQHDGVDMQRIREQVIELALRHHLVSKFTSLVAVDVTPARAAHEQLHKKNIAGNLPHGQQFESIFGNLPRTAAGLTEHLYLGLLLLSLALLLAHRELIGAGRDA